MTNRGEQLQTKRTSMALHVAVLMSAALFATAGTLAAQKNVTVDGTIVEATVIKATQGANAKYLNAEAGCREDGLGLWNAYVDSRQDWILEKVEEADLHFTEQDGSKLPAYRIRSLKNNFLADHAKKRDPSKIWVPAKECGLVLLSTYQNCSRPWVLTVVVDDLSGSQHWYVHRHLDTGNYVIRNVWREKNCVGNESILTKEGDGDRVIMTNNMSQTWEFVPKPDLLKEVHVFKQVEGYWKAAGSCSGDGKCKISESTTVGVTKGTEKSKSKDFTASLQIAIESEGGVPGLGKSKVTATAGVSATTSSTIAESFSIEQTKTKAFECEGKSLWQWVTEVKEFEDPFRRIGETVTIANSSVYHCSQSTLKPSGGLTVG